MKISDYAFLLTVLEHHGPNWKKDFDDSVPRTKGQKKGATILDDRVDEYEEWGNRVESWKAHQYWDAWMLKAQCQFLEIDEDGTALDDTTNQPKPKGKCKNNKEKKIKLWAG